MVKDRVRKSGFSNMKEPIKLTAGEADTTMPMKDVEEGMVATMVAEVIGTDGAAEAQTLYVASSEESASGGPERLLLCRSRIY